MDQACERSGTFAVLESNGFRSLCAPCWTLSRHRLETRDTSVGAMAGTLWSLLARFWMPAVGFFMLEAIPHAAVAWQREVPWWFSIPYGLVVGSFFEGLVLALIAEEVLGGRRGLKGALRVIERRYFAMVGINSLTTLTFFAGMAALCLPAVAVSALLDCAVPLVLLERMPPHRAYWESGRRSWPAFWPLVVLSAGLLFVSLAPSFLASIGRGVALGLKYPLTEEQLSVWRVGVVLLAGFLKAPSALFQLVVWGATRPPPVSAPVPAAVPAADPAP